MIRSLLPPDFDAILKVINDAAQAYKGVIPNDRWKEPYMSAEELKEEIEAGVRFFGWVEGGHLLGVTGIQALKPNPLLRRRRWSGRRHLWFRSSGGSRKEAAGRGEGSSFSLAIKFEKSRLNSAQYYALTGT